MYGNGSPSVWLVVVVIFNMDIIDNISSDRDGDLHPFVSCLDMCLHLYNENRTAIENSLTGDNDQLLKLLDVTSSHPQSNIDHEQDLHHKRTVTVDRLFYCHKACMEFVMSTDHTKIGK